MNPIVVFSVWASNTLKMRSWMTHASVVGVWAWLRCDLAFPFWKDWHPLPPPVSRLGPREFGEDASEGTAFCIIHPYSLSLHHHRYVDCAVGAACTASGGMAHVSLAHNHSSTRLHDSVHQATSQFNCVLETLVAVRNAPVLREEIAVLLAKDAIEPVPPAEMRQGFHSPYFIVPKKGGQQPILDRRVLNRALHKLPFKMLTCSCIIKCIQPQDWFAAIDLKDAYIHVSILLWHRPFLRFAFEGRAW